MMTSPLALQMPSEIGPGLRVEFFRTENQYAHRILALEGPQTATPILETVEHQGIGTPLSPVLQGLNVEDLRAFQPQSGRIPPAAMLIGMADRLHFSLSVSFEQRGTGWGLVFDVACRSKEFPARLTSVYTPLGGVQIEQETDSIQFRSGTTACMLRPLPIDATSPELTCEVAIVDEQIEIQRETPNATPSSATWRWRYALWLTRLT